MSSHADFASLEQLHLLHHGDAIERFYWPKVSSHLSEYEVFWKRFVVLLTYRVDPSAICDWIMMRAHRSHLGRGSQHSRGLIPKLEHLPASKDDPKLLWSYTRGLKPDEMTDALEYQQALWTELATYLQGIWKGYVEAFAELRLDATFINDVGLAPFLPIHQGIATTVFPATANRHGASGMNFYDDNEGS